MNVPHLPQVFSARPDMGKSIGLYVCGVTVYDFAHIGHARAYVAFDVLFRYLTRSGYDVTYVRNFTDVDDKILARAAVTGQPPLELANRFADEFLQVGPWGLSPSFPLSVFLFSSPTSSCRSDVAFSPPNFSFLSLFADEFL